MEKCGELASSSSGTFRSLDGSQALLGHGNRHLSPTWNSSSANLSTRAPFWVGPKQNENRLIDEKKQVIAGGEGRVGEGKINERD